MQLLRDFIVQEIRKRGKITFAKFMEMVLYHPQYGYYTSGKERVGKQGDYYTSPTVHKMFGELIAKQLEEMWRIMDEEPFTVIEMGANKGWLCSDIIQCIKRDYPAFYHHLHYIVIETNPYAREKLMLLLHSIESIEKKVSWHFYSENGFSFDEVQGCFLSNEFIDAFPVHRLKIKNRDLKEIYVGYNGFNFFEIEDEVSTHALKKYLERFPIYFEEGQECEINLHAAQWLKHISEKLRRGFVLTIDYGDTTNGIYREGNTTGTIRCFYQHTVNRDFYRQLGEQDITAHVDFTSLMDIGKSLGLKVTGFAKQSHYLIALGILERLNAMGNDIGTILKVKNLFHPEGMGEIFKVLIQHKNIAHPHLTSLRPLHSVTM